MRKVIFQMMISLDGFFEGPNRELDWHNVDEEFNEYAIGFLHTVDTLLFGRVTYELMAGYWPTLSATTNDPIVAGKMNSLRKMVFSKTLQKVGWENTQLVKENIGEEILKLKRELGKNIAMFGSSDLALTFIKQNLIDEYRIIVNPVVLGKGKSLFSGLEKKISLRLTNTKRFDSGKVLLYYKPV